MSRGAVVLLTCAAGSVVALGCALTNPKPPLADATRLPSFPDPRPSPSAQRDLPTGVCAIDSPEPMEATYDRLKDRLKAAGIDKWSLYAFGDGFAVVTQLEQVEPGGEPTATRFVTRHPKLLAKGFDIAEYPPLLFLTSAGRYRHFALLVSSTDGAGVKTAEVPIEGDEVWAGELPEEMHDLMGVRTCEALVYEYQRPSDSTQSASLRPRSEIGADQHLIGAGIFTASELR